MMGRIKDWTWWEEQKIKHDLKNRRLNMMWFSRKYFCSNILVHDWKRLYSKQKVNAGYKIQMNPICREISCLILFYEKPSKIFTYFD